MRRLRCTSSAVLLFSTLLLTGLTGAPAQAQTADMTGNPADLATIVRKFGEPLNTVAADPQAISLFAGQIGPALGLHDAATALAAKTMPPKVAKELGMPELTASAQRLVASLAAWQAADRLLQSINDHSTPIPPLQAGLVNWVHAISPFPALVDTATALAPGTGQADPAILAVSAGRVAVEAQQRATTEWWQLKTWRDRVRTTRGRNRLCGTWQWTVHNHQQHHQDQKLVLIFPPPGSDHPAIQGLVETVVLGENVYLRWERDGHMQEDSLQFIKEGKWLEGTFVNSQGGWGSISGKRTSDCKLQ